MSNIDDAKGRVKEAAGDVTGNDNLKAEGKTDRAAGAVKDATDSVKDKAQDVLHKD
jgi:uncharacterized protein YjbJ (UPF0337 family)